MPYLSGKILSTLALLSYSDSLSSFKLFYLTFAIKKISVKIIVCVILGAIRIKTRNRAYVKTDKYYTKRIGKISFIH